MRLPRQLWGRPAARPDRPDSDPCESAPAEFAAGARDHGQTSGKPCGSAAVTRNTPCRMHRGARGFRRSADALKHGHCTREAIEKRRQVQRLIRQARKLVLEIE